MDNKRRPARVITFYSYKGGTGRSMALANIAWILACNRKRVLVIDWDLEAPGLHRYFRPFLIDDELRSSPGLIDLIDKYATQAIHPVDTDSKPAPDWYLEYADFADYVLSINFDQFPHGGKIDLLPAGRQTSSYAITVNSFNWQNFYDRLGGGGFLDAVKQVACTRYDYVLIDSRTGVSDTAGICTVQMPETLVVCFTYNNQSIKGAAAVARSSVRLRAKLIEEKLATSKVSVGNGKIASVDDTPPPFRIFPVPMRVDSGESDRLAIRQAFARDCFSDLLSHLGPSEVGDYWSAVEVPTNAFYAYEEVLSPFKDEPQDPKTVLAAFVRLTRYLADPETIEFRLPIAPALKQRFLEAFAETPLTANAKKVLAQTQRETEEQALIRTAEMAMAGLSEDEKAVAVKVFGRLVKLGIDMEGGGRFPIRASISDFDESEKAVIAKLSRQCVIKVMTTEHRGMRRSAAGRDQTVGFTDERLLKLWKPLLEWLDADSEFLIWRQQLRAYMADWERSGREDSALLSGKLLVESELWRLKRPRDLNNSETDYLETSRNFANTQPPAGEAFRELRSSAASDPKKSLKNVPLAAVGAREESAGTDSVGSRRRGVRYAKSLTLAAAAVIVSIVAGVYLSETSFRPVDDVSLSSHKPDDAETVRQSIAEAETLVQSGDLAAAAKSYQLSLLHDNRNIKALLGLASVFDRKGDFSSSSRLYEQAVEISPANPDVLFNRGWSRLLQRDFESALADFNQAIQLDSKNATYYFARAAARQGLNDSKGAIADYSEAIRWKQEYAEAYLNRARLYEQTGAKRDAIADYQSIVSLPTAERDAQFANERLTALRGAETAGTTSGPRVFLHYNDRGDTKRMRDLGKELAQRLRVDAISAPRLVSVRTPPEVRYFFRQDESFARDLKNATEFALGKQGILATLQITYRDAKNFPAAQPGTVEVWLPSLMHASLSPVTRQAAK
jgi:MinD-like ATPase involved in chromosome partitioning or flagellar assembly/Tfp pilus assembly protein PilF